ncbi:MAG: CHAT domain-containing protein [Byssovorax sp.]
MKSYVVQVFRKTSQSVLRFFDDPTAARPLPVERPLPPEPIEAFTREVDADYRKRAPNLADIGNRLYRWLDGPTERWLERILAEPATLHLDVDERLRHLPWELLCRDGAFLCANPLRPFTPVRRVAPATTLPLFTPAPLPANRPLRVLFMASSPENIEPVLDFEREESLILGATQGHPIDLLVEESGTLEGLKERIDERGQGYFDVFHLTGHADVSDGKPCFVLENETGQARIISADELARTFSNVWPRLVFLSGCKTGQAVDQGQLPSLCEALILAGAPAVLGWALPVSDHAASLAAKEIYDRLAAGKSIDEAVAYARCKLLEDNIPDWHLLRLYANAVSLGALVTPERTPKRERIRIRSAQKELLDAGAQIEVCPREQFVGRRRVLQRCLKVLRAREGDAMYAEGILLHGLGGTGKSSLAARLLDRMPSHRQRFVWVGAIDEIAFLRVVSDGCPEAIEILNRTLSLKARIRQILEGPLAQEPALFIFDDFEHNLDRMSVAAGLKPAALDVIASLLAAIRESASDCRVIVTCRYAFPLPGPARLHEEMLESMRGPELGKKLAQLDHLRSGATGDSMLRRLAIELGAGNPRLLEWLDKVLGAQEDKVLSILRAMGEKAEAFREAIFLDGLLKQQTVACRRMLALLSVVNLPVDRATVDAVVAGEVDPHLEKAREVGLLEVAIHSGTGASRFLVPGIVRPALAGEIMEEERKDAYGRAAHRLYTTWVAPDADTSEERALEVHRLACAGGNKDVAGTMCAAIAHSWLERSRFREVVELCRATLQLGDDYRVLHALATAKNVLGETILAESYCEKALVQCRADVAHTSDSDALDEQGSIANSLAMILSKRGQLERALKLWSEVLAIATKLDRPRAKAAVIGNIAGVVNERNGFDEALELWNKSIAISEQSGDLKSKAATLSCVVTALYDRGRLGEALTLVDEVLELCEQGENRRYKATMLNSKAAILMSQDEVTRAADLWDEALKIQQEIGDAEGEAQTLCNMAYVPARRGEVDKALELWGKASALKGKIGDMLGQAKAIRNMASLLASHGQAEKALELLSEAVALETRVEATGQ